MNKLRTVQSGFTIIELMLAMVVFSIMLIMVTVSITGIGRLYYKGINQAKVQNNVRTISDEISDNLKFGASFNEVTGTTATGGAYQTVYCTGLDRYTFVLNQRVADEIPHVLWRDTIQPGSCDVGVPDLGTATPGGENGTELIASGASLSQLEIVPTPGDGSTLHQIRLIVAYGESDLFVDPNNRVQCRGTESGGDQFCAIARLTTKVVERQEIR